MKEIFLVGIIFAFHNGLLASESGFSLNLSARSHWIQQDTRLLTVNFLSASNSAVSSQTNFLSASNSVSSQTDSLSASNSVSSQTDSLSASNSVSSQIESDKEDPQIKGVILAFHQWPLNKEQKEEVLKKAKKLGLEKKKELPVFKTWVFTWSDQKKGINAQQACRPFSNLSFLEYCELDVLLKPDTKDQ